MPEHHLDDRIFKPGHKFTAGPFQLDLYRLLCAVAGDKAVAKQAVRWKGIDLLQDEFRDSEITRILMSTAIALRILFDQHPKLFRLAIPNSVCGRLYAQWPKRAHETLTLREACNKIVHATKINYDLVIPDRRHNPDEEGSYVQPFLYLYGTKDRKAWRAKLALVDFIGRASAAFYRV